MKNTCKGCYVMGTIMLDGVKTCEYCGLKVVPIKPVKEVKSGKKDKEQKVENKTEVHIDEVDIDKVKSNETIVETVIIEEVETEKEV